MYGQLTITHPFYASFPFFFFQKQTWTLKSDIISRVIYLQLTGGVSVGETTDRCFISVDEKNYKQTLRVTCLGRNTL